MPMSFAGHGLVSGSAIPYQRTIEPSQLGVFLNLEQAELLRLRRYAELWKFYQGQHWAFAREQGDPLVTINLMRRIVDKGVSWLVGAGMSITVPDAFKNHTLPVLREVWQYNGGIIVDAKGTESAGQLLYDIAQVGGVTGDVFILITYAEPTAQARKINPHTKGRIRIQVLSSEQVYPQWDPLNTNILTAVRIETIFYDQSPGEPPMDHQGRQLQVRRFSQIITRDKIIEQYQGQDPVEHENPLGEIPLVHIRNHSLANEYYGMSDLDSLIDLQRELNEKCTDVSDIVNYHAAPVIVVKGAKVKQMERSARNVWSGLPVDSDVKHLDTAGDLGASVNYITMMYKFLLMVGEIPENSLGQAQPISNTSGVALHTQYQSLVEKIMRKKATYEPGLAAVNYYILRIKELTDPSFKMPTDLCKNCGGRIVEFMDIDQSCQWCGGSGQIPAETYYGPNRTTDEPVSCSCVRVTKKCYQIDPQTFEFLPPEKVKLRFARQHSFGSSIEEATLEQIEAEHGQVSASRWDPQEEQSAEAKAQQDFDAQQAVAPAPQPTEEGAPPPELPAGPQPVQPPQLPPQAIELPPEPETITLRQTVMNPLTGETALVSEFQIEVVPADCEVHEYANPYEAAASLKDTLPKDKQIQANLFETYLRLGIVSVAWCRRNIEEIAPDADRIAKEIEKEKAAALQAPGATPPEGQPGPSTGRPGSVGGEEYQLTGGGPAATQP